MSLKKKIYELQQFSNAESGSTCFCMVAGYYKKWISPEEAYKLCGGTKKGCFPKGIVLAAEELDFDADLVETDIDNIKNYPLPLILCVNQTEYTVLEDIQKNHFYVCDPKKGHITYTTEELREIYGGSIISMVPNENFTPSEQNDNGYRYGLKKFNQNKKETILYSIFLALAAVFSIAFPKLNSAYANQLLNEDSVYKGILLPFLLLLLISLVLQIFNVIYYGKIYKKISTTTNYKFVEKLFSLPLMYYEIRNPGDLNNRKDNNQIVTNFIVLRLCDFVIKMLIVVVCLILIAIYSLTMLLIILFVTVLMYAITNYSAKVGSQVNRVFFSLIHRLNDFTYDIFSSIMTIKNAGADSSFLKKTMEMNDQTCMAKKKKVRYVSVITNLPNGLTDFAKLLIISVGVCLALRNNMPLEVLIAIMGFFSIICSPLQELTNINNTFSTMEYNLDRSRAIEEAPECTRVLGDGETPEERITGDIVLENVSFSYARHAAPFIKDLNMTIHRGEHVALVGASGGGKTTIKKLIMAEVKPLSGKITYDGKTRTNIPDKVFIRSFGAVDQSIMLFPDTIMNNIKMWNENISDSVSIAAAKDAEIYELITGRPNGFNGMVAEKGKNFSGGERQRIEIARVLSLNPSILILDEATSALDAVLEKKIADRCAKRDITTIIIAHRLSTIRNCDRIFVIDHGRIAAVGTHEELMSSCPIYYDLVTKE